MDLNSDRVNGGLFSVRAWGLCQGGLLMILNLDCG